MRNSAVLFLAAGLAGAAAAAASDGGFTFDTLRARAQALAAAPFQPPAVALPPALAALTYDEHRDIRFRPPQSWGHDDALPFQLQFFHLGWLFKEPVAMHALVDGREAPLEFDPAQFDYGRNRGLASLPHDLGFAGFRVHYALNQPGHLDELAVFLGASYFRALGAGQIYGTSARGLAVDTAEPTGEIFPRFSAFWVERPAPDARELMVFALLDSPVATGAYAFRITPGTATAMHVRAALFVRAGAVIKTLGVAPLTSMFWRGENSGTSHGDFRPEVHDADGLLMARGDGEWLWRPLQDPAAARTSTFTDKNPRGFGLAQRDRDFRSYEDLEARYERRPSVWVEPVGDWGAGAVRLVELHTPDETQDNIVAFWTPAEPARGGQQLDFEYRLRWFMDGREGAIAPPAGFVRATRYSSFVLDHPEQRLIIVDFDGGGLRDLSGDAGVEADVTIARKEILLHQGLQKNEVDGSWRLTLVLAPGAVVQPVEMRAFLRRGRQALTETWTYLWQPEPPRAVDSSSS